jgi:VWFA-related protein
VRRWAATLVCWSGIALFSVVLSGNAALAQQNQPEIVSHQAPATFDSRVNLVSVPVVVRDRDGHPVGILRQEDFQLFDKGRAQVITKFSMETSVGEAKSAPAAIAVPAGPAAAPVAPTETAAKPVFPDRYVAYLFDDVHFKPGDLLNARQAANRHLDNALDPNSRGAVFTVSGRTTQDFTSDAGKLHAAVNRIQPWSQVIDKAQDCPYITYYMADFLVNQTQELSPVASEAVLMRAVATDPLLAAVFSEAANCLHTDHRDVIIPAVRGAAQRVLQQGTYETQTSLMLLLDLMRNMSTLPGTRTIVMVSPGFIVPAQYRLFENDVFDQAIRLGVTINTLDIRGVYPPVGMDASQGGALPGGLGAAMLQAENADASQSGDLLAELAAGTGGTFFHNSNALEDGLKQLASRPEYVYVLGFSPDNLKFDGSYHGLKVKLKPAVNRQELTKLEVEARRGYWAPNHSADPAEQAREDLHDAVFSREEMLDIPMQLHTEFFKQNDAKAELTVETRVDVRGLKFKKAEDRNRDNLIVVISLFDQNGRYMKGTEKTMELRLRDQTLESVRNSRLEVDENFDVPPGRYMVRVVVRDSEGRSMAARNEGVEIP